MRAGLAMFFQTLDDPWLMEIAGKIVAELELDHFFNIQLVGDKVIEINPRISTIVYQEDLNLPYLGVKRALGEIDDEGLAALAARIRPTRRALRYFDQVEWDADPGQSRSGASRPRTGLEPVARAVRAPEVGQPSRYALSTARSTSPGSRGRTSRRCASSASTRSSSSSTAASSTPTPTSTCTGRTGSCADS